MTEATATEAPKFEFTPVDEVPSITREGKASKSSSIVQSFMESNLPAVRLDGLEAKPASTKAILKRYVETRELPVEVYTRKDAVYLKRTDLNGEDTSE